MPSQPHPHINIRILAAAIASDCHDTTDTPMADHGSPPDGLPMPQGPGCEPVPISEARHVPDTAPNDPRLARVFKIYIIERLMSVHHAAR